MPSTLAETERVTLHEKADGAVRLMKTKKFDEEEEDSRRKFFKSSRRLSMTKTSAAASSPRLSMNKSKSPSLRRLRLSITNNKKSVGHPGMKGRSYDDLYKSFLLVERENAALRSLAVPKVSTQNKLVL